MYFRFLLAQSSLAVQPERPSRPSKYVDAERLDEKAILQTLARLFLGEHKNVVQTLALMFSCFYFFHGIYVLQAHIVA